MRRRVAVYEKTVARLKHAAKVSGGRIDVFWPGLMLAEHRSAGADLDAAFQQAADYSRVSPTKSCRFVVVSDFRRIRLYDLEEQTRRDFPLKEFHKHIQRFGFIAGYQRQKVREQDPINIEAVQKLGDLHDTLKRDGYSGHALEVFLVRLLFCLFADDTGIFLPKDSFTDLIERYTAEDGGNIGDELHRLFVVLNTPEDKRQKSLPEQFKFFPYVNGKLFEERLDPPSFNADMRRMLLALCELHWGAISPAILGAMFQAVIELDARDRRRQLGAHYTSEANILKLIGPLFLDELRAELEKARLSKTPGKAAVHCVIIGFAAHKLETRRLFEYEHVKGEPHEVAVKSVNPYLVDAPEPLLLPKRRVPISPLAPAMAFGSMPNEGGHLILGAEQQRWESSP